MTSIFDNTSHDAYAAYKAPVVKVETSSPQSDIYVGDLLLAPVRSLGRAMGAAGSFMQTMYSRMSTSSLEQQVEDLERIGRLSGGSCCDSTDDE